MTWPEVEAASREAVVLIPTGSLEQHGPHLPLFTDSLIATAVAEAVEARLPDRVLLTPTLWLGASAHHLGFPGSLSASFDTYIGAVRDVVTSLAPHGFTKFFVLNAHGGNTEPNGIALREMKAAHPNLMLGHGGYFVHCAEEARRLMKGPLKEIRHACEAETSLALHLFPDLVRRAALRDDGLTPHPKVSGLVFSFSEVTEQGSFGFATLADEALGKALFEAAVEGVTQDMKALAEGVTLLGPEVEP